MALIYDSALKDARLAAVRDALNGGSLELQTSGGTTLASFPLAATAGAVASGVLTLAFAQSSVQATAAGTVTQAVIKDSSGAARVTGLAEGADFTIDNPTLMAGQTVSMGTFTITHA